MYKRRKFEFFDMQNLQDCPVYPLDWNLCIICQQPSNDKLICPTSAGYTSLVSNLTQFAEKDELPKTVKLQLMDEGDGIMSTLITRKAKYHKLSRSRYDEYKLNKQIVGNRIHR